MQHYNRSQRQTKVLSSIKPWCLLLTISLFSLIGCSTGAHSIIPEEGLTMDDIYYQAIGDRQDLTQNKDHNNKNTKNKDTDKKPKGLHQPVVVYTGYIRTASNEINSQFKPLPNPNIPMFIYPHFAKLGDEFVPVPGYTTTFFLYKHNQYAMNTEVY